MRADAQRNRARILGAAQEVFADVGSRASTDEVARRAGVAVGTVFRHFPTKRDLLAAIMKERLVVIAARAEELAGDPTDGLYTLFRELVEIAAETRSVADLLGLSVGEEIVALRATVEPLVDNGQRVGTIRRDVSVDEVLALLSATCQGNVAGRWGATLRERTVGIVLDGLRSSRSL